MRTPQTRTYSHLVAEAELLIPLDAYIHPTLPSHHRAQGEKLPIAWESQLESFL